MTAQPMPVGDDDLPRPARPHPAALARVTGRSRPGGSAHLEDRIRDLCAELLDGLAGRRAVRLRAGLRRPAAVDGHRLAARRARRPTSEWVRELIDTTFHLDPEKRDDQRHLADAPASSCTSTSSSSSASGAADPQDDMLSDLMAAELTDDDGDVRQLTTDEAAAFADLLVSAGTETVARLLGWAAVLLDAAPRPAGRAGRRPRRSSPTPSRSCCATRRRRRCRAAGPPATSSCTASTIPADSKVLLLTGSAGRDERKYPDADRFDVRRTFDHHVSFGYGIHFCLGAALARSRAGSPSRRCWPAGPSGPSTTTPPSACTRARSAAGSTSR